MNKETLKQILDAMRLHTAETHPLVETERAMEAVEAKLAQPAQDPARREQQLFMDEQAFYAAGHQAMRPAELAERLKQGEKWAVGQEQPAQPLTDEQCRAKFEAWYWSAPDANAEPDRIYDLTDESMSELTKDCLWLGWKAAHDTKEQP